MMMHRCTGWFCKAAPCGGLRQAKIGDTELTGRELAQLGRFWALNGYAERPKDPFLDARLGQTFIGSSL